MAAKQRSLPNESTPSPKPSRSFFNRSANFLAVNKRKASTGTIMCKQQARSVGVGEGETADLNLSLWKLSRGSGMLSAVHRPRFRRLFLISLLALSGSARAAAPPPGQIDNTFVPAPGTNDAINVVIPQPDGKVVAAG